MTKTLLSSKGDWVQLVAQWVRGVGHEDDTFRSTATHTELWGVLRAEPSVMANFLLESQMSRETLRYSQVLVEKSSLKPESYPCVAVWQFNTVPYADLTDKSYLFLDAHIEFVSREDLK